MLSETRLDFPIVGENLPYNLRADLVFLPSRGDGDEPFNLDLIGV